MSYDSIDSALDEVISHQIYLMIYQTPGAEINKFNVLVKDGVVSLQARMRNQGNFFKLRNWIRQIPGVNLVQTELIITT